MKEVLNNITDNIVHTQLPSPNLNVRKQPEQDKTSNSLHCSHLKFQKRKPIFKIELNLIINFPSGNKSTEI